MALWTAIKLRVAIQSDHCAIHFLCATRGDKCMRNSSLCDSHLACRVLIQSELSGVLRWRQQVKDLLVVQLQERDTDGKLAILEERQKKLNNNNEDNKEFKIRRKTCPNSGSLGKNFPRHKKLLKSIKPCALALHSCLGFRIPAL